MVFTVLFSVVSVGSVLGALVAARRREVTVWNVGMSSLGFGATMAALAVVPSVATAMPSPLVLGVFSITFLTMSTAIVQMRAEPEMRVGCRLQAMLFLAALRSASDRRLGRPGVRALVDRAGAVACVHAGGWGW